MIGCINKQSMSFVMLIIRNSSNWPLHLHFFLHYSSGEGRGPFFIIYSVLLGLVLSQVIFFYNKTSFKSREIGSFFTQNPFKIEENKNAYHYSTILQTTILQQGELVKKQMDETTGSGMA